MATTPTTTPAATPATLVPPLFLELLVEGLPVASPCEAGCVTTTVVPGATLVTTVDAPLVAPGVLVVTDELMVDVETLLLLLELELEPPAFATFCSVPVR